MGSVIVEMSMSLDGYIAGPRDSDSSPLGDGGREVFDELRGETGAMVAGRRLYDITHGWSGSHPFTGIPVFVVTHAVPATVPAGTTPFTFVSEGVANAVARAQLAAAGKSVYVIGGASIGQQLLAAGLVDELRIDVIPILLGGGVSLFGELGAPRDLEQAKVTVANDVIHLRYRVARTRA